MTARIIMCGNDCGHNHEALNGPTGCCSKHGPYMYYCNECHESWRSKHPLTSEAIAMMADPKVSYSKAAKTLAAARKIEGKP